MKWTTATALFLALSAGGVGVTAVMNRKPKEPRQILKEIQANIDATNFDRDSAVERLAAALEDDSIIADPELEQELLRMRADIYTELKSYKEARGDLEILQSKGNRDDRDLALEIIQLRAMEADQVEAALNPLRQLTQTEPDFGEAWALAGQLSTAAAEKKLEKALNVAASNLAKSDAPAVLAVIRELASRAPDDPERDALLTELNRSFYTGTSTAANEIQQLVTEPRFDFKEARRFYANALNELVAPEIVVALGELLERAGQLDLSIQLHRAARNLPNVAEDPEAMAAFLGQLLKANRTAEGVKALQEWDYTLGGSVEFYRSAGEVFFRAGEFAALRQIGQGLSDYGGDIGRYWQRFFAYAPVIQNASRMRANSKARQSDLLAGQMTTAIKSLKGFVDAEDSPEPFYGAKNAARFLIADAFNVLGQKPNERLWLRRAIENDPNASARAWIRLADLLRDQGNVPWKQVEESLSKAMDLDPSLTKDVAQRWYEAGQNRLKKEDRTLGDFLRRISRAGFSAIAPGSAGPSTMTLIARDQLQNGNFYEAIRAAELARKEYRNLVPPLDIIIRAKLANSQTRAPKDDIIRRIETAGIDGEVERFMAQLEGGRLDGAELVRAIKAAPARFGKAAVARYYLTLDDPATAGETLVELKDSNAPSELKLLRARLLVESEKFDEALAELAELRRQSSGSPPDPDAILLEMDALIGSSKVRELDGPAERLLEGVRLTHPHQLEAIDRLATFGRVDLAIQALEKLDKAPQTRTPDFYRRRVLVDALTAETRGKVLAEESILRAEPYLRDGTPEMTALVLAVGDREWTRLPDLVDRLLDTNFRPTVKQEAALSLLGERLQSGTRAAREGVRRSPRDPDWAFLSAVASSLVDAKIEMPRWFGPDAAGDALKLLRGRARRSPKDPRDALMLYLMSTRSEWSAWVLPRLTELARETGSTMWSQWLLARVLQERTDHNGSARVIASLIEKHPRFGPAHDTALRIAERNHPTEPLHPQLARARRIRLQSLGEDLIDDPIEIALAEAGELARRNKNKEAVQRLRPVVKPGSPAETEGRLMLGLLMIREGEYSFASAELNEALNGQPGIFKEVVIDSLLFSLRRSIEAERTTDSTPQRGKMTEEESLALLDDLQQRYPLDPMVALTHLQLQPILPSNKGLRAGPRLERIFETSGRKTLDELRRGCTRRWVDFLLPIAPETARELLERDLEIEPGNLDVWQLLGDVAAHAGDTEAAQSYYETLLAIDPRPDAAFALADLLIEQGARAAEVKPILTQASRIQAGGSARATYLTTVADLRDKYLNGPSEKNMPQLRAIVPRLRGLWRSRERIRREVDTIDLGLLYADALFRHLRELELTPEREARKRVAVWRKEDRDAGIETPGQELLALRQREAMEADQRLGQELAVEYESTQRDLGALMSEFVEISETSLYVDQVVKALSGLAKAIDSRNLPAEFRRMGTEPGA
ncbi:MAG: tetratricopeptide repeat protein [Planctomycetota bacterium]